MELARLACDASRTYPLAVPNWQMSASGASASLQPSPFGLHPLPPVGPTALTATEMSVIIGGTVRFQQSHAAAISAAYSWHSLTPIPTVCRFDCSPTYAAEPRGPLRTSTPRYRRNDRRGVQQGCVRPKAKPGPQVERAYSTTIRGRSNPYGLPYELARSFSVTASIHGLTIRYQIRAVEALAQLPRLAAGADMLTRTDRDFANFLYLRT